MTKDRRIKQQIAAAQRRAAKTARHAAMMRAHAERRAKIAQWENAYDAWLDADCIGPEPVHPDNVQPFYSIKGDADLLRAATELGIDLAR